jgi:hypothetical protein
MSKYLYGASVQGIQDFIFKTNKLQEIVGASEIVKSIDTMIDKYEPKAILVQAAGNIKAVFHDKPVELVKEFPKKVMQKAYGITISQAVVVMAGDQPTKEELNLLEQQLKTQRNKPSIPLDLSINIMELASKTARPLVEKDMDYSIKQKRDAYAIWFKNGQIEDKEFEKSKELSYISNGKNKLAVIHADGNGLGQLIPKLANIPEFSKGLEKATDEAYEEAKKVIKDDKIRKIILGGDDMTVICDATYALEFTKVFLEKFEELTEKYTQHKLTACAGVAYSNEKYPFHYAVGLAEVLCGITKKNAKKLVEGSETPAPSSLMFHNIQSSNFQSWEKFVKDELTIPNDKNTIRCDFGPYYLTQEGQPKIENFLNTVEAYRCEASPISKLRSWLGELAKSHEFAKNWLDRINQMLKENNKWNCKIMENNLENLYHGLSNEVLIVDKDDFKKTPIYDVLQILSVTEAKK